MKKFCLILFIALLSPLGSTAHTEDTNGETRTDSIASLLTNIDDTITVILIENENYIIKTSLSIFKTNIEEWLTINPHLISDQELLDLVLKESEKTNSINALTIAIEHNLKDRLEYRAADLLESGQCMIINKNTNECISTIKIQTFDLYCGSLCGYGGRRFFINDIQVLNVLDWVS